MTKVSFDVSTLADALRRAEKIAPNRGEAFDKAAGLLLSIESSTVVIKSTNLATKFSTWITPQEIVGPPVTWRMSSKVLTEVVSKLKTGRSTHVILEQEGGRVKMNHGSTRGSFGLMDANDYPSWIPFDPDDMELVDDLSDITGRVQWAASKGTNIPMTGIHFTGKAALATDRYRICSMPCTMPLKEPITVPSGVLNAVIPSGVPTRARVDGHQLYLMPDEYTQISTVVYGVAYPPIERIMKRDYPQLIKLHKSYLLDMLQLANSMADTDRDPVMRVFVGDGTIAVMMENAGGQGHLGDIMELPGQATNKRIERKYKPEYLIGAVENSISQEIVVGYNPDAPTEPLYINGGGGVEFWLAPISPQAAAAAANVSK